MKGFIVSLPFRVIKGIVKFLFYASVVSLIVLIIVLILDENNMNSNVQPMWYLILYLALMSLSKHYLKPFLKTKFSMQSIHRFILMVGSFVSLLILLFGIYGSVFGSYVFLLISLILVLINVLAFKTHWNS